ncbi:MAG TPA: hypothetical protein PLO89_08725, partial [Spirochaetota bacterium]|nr:hypothetical protein [Spirochaetota bacterium]
KGAELYNMIDFLPVDERYSYIHNGYCQTLDHILVSGGMLKRAPKIDVVRCFTEIGYAEKSVFSDHEPLTSSFIFGSMEPDITPPEWISDFPKVTGVTNGSANLYAKINEKGFIYYTLLYKDSPAPSISQLIAGKDGNNALSLFSGKIKAYAKGLNIIPIKDLEPGAAYVLYTIAEDDENPPNPMKDIAALDFETLAIDSSLKNGSFEENYEGEPVDWSVTTSGKFYVNNELGYDGNNCAYFETLTTSISGREVASVVFTIDKTKPIGASSYFYSPVEVGRTKVSLKIYFYSDSEGNTLCGNSTMTSTSLKEKDSWEKIEYDVNSDKIPADAKSAKIALRVSYVKGVGTSSDRVYIDSVVLESDD